MRTLRLAVCDLAPDWNPADNPLTRAAAKAAAAAGYELAICPPQGTPESDPPDFVLCGTFGQEFLRYSCCRILFTGEDNVPDFNLYDYAMGFPHLDFGARYLRLPLYCLRDTWAPALQKHTLGRDFYLNPARKFCNFVVSNDFSAERNAFFAALAAHRPVDSGGEYANNIGGPVADKLAFQKNYKFSIAYENSRDPGYCTEKLVDAFAAGTVPIYWGDPLVKAEFNPAAFLCADDYPDPAALIAAIDALDADDAAYLAMCEAPILAPDGKSAAAAFAPDGESAATAFFAEIIAAAQGESGTAGAIRRSRGCWAQNYENDLRYYHRLAADAARPKSLLQRILGR